MVTKKCGRINNLDLSAVTVVAVLFQTLPATAQPVFDSQEYCFLYRKLPDHGMIFEFDKIFVVISFE
jgi:hypothetical protein